MKFAPGEKLLALLLVFMLASSCATLPPPGTHLTDEERQTAKNRCIAQYTATAAIGGAILGAAIGALAGGGRGAATGALAGGIGGGIIGFVAAWNHCISLFSNLDTYPVADYNQTAQDIGYQASQGDVVLIKDFAISPNVVAPGSTVYFTGKYIVMNADPNARDIKVLIERGVALVNPKTNTYSEPSRFEPTEKVIDATSRTNALDGDFEIPDKLPDGKFRVIVRVTSLGKTVTESAEVEVNQKAPKAEPKKKADIAPKAATPAPAKTEPAPVSANGQEKLAPPARGAAAPNQAVGAKSVAEPKNTGKAPTLKEARQAKKDQDLEGYLFQNSTSKVWYLENEDGTYKLKNGKFVLIPSN